MVDLTRFGPKQAAELAAQAGNRNIAPPRKLADQVQQRPANARALPGKQKAHIIDAVFVIVVQQDVTQKLVEPFPPGSPNRGLDLPQTAVDDQVAIGSVHIGGARKHGVQGGGHSLPVGMAMPERGGKDRNVLDLCPGNRLQQAVGVGGFVVAKEKAAPPALAPRKK